MPHVFSPGHPAHGARWTGRLILCALGGLALVGCEDDAIRQYTAPKAEAPENVRLFGVIYPHGDLTWFFKLIGPDSAVQEQANAFDDFMQSVHFTDHGERPVEWKLPEGWQPVAEAKANAPERYATLRMRSKDDKTLDLTIVKFPGNVGGVLANVNRWRGQIGLTPIGADDLEKATKKVTFNGDTAITVSMVGPGVKAGGVRPPFMDMPGGAQDKTPLRYTKPEGWEETPDAGGPITRAAVFKARDGDQTAEITVTALPGDAGGLLQNVNRWRGQLKLDPLTEEQARDFPKIEAAGASVPLIDTGEGAGHERIVGAAVSHGDQTWFFKMKGPSGVVEKQKSRFQDFLKSVKFDAGKGDEE